MYFTSLVLVTRVNAASCFDSCLPPSAGGCRTIVGLEVAAKQLPNLLSVLRKILCSTESSYVSTISGESCNVVQLTRAESGL
jgi:hypothetical protein